MHVTPVDLAGLPKAELHVHLEGTISAETAAEFAAREGAPPPPRVFHDLPSFIDSFIATMRTLTRPDDYARITREYCEAAARQGVRYIEMTTTPLSLDFEVRREALRLAVAEADATDVVVRWIVDVPRLFTEDVGWDLLDAALSQPGVFALGLGGPEAGYPPEAWANVFAKAREAGLLSIPHAGEAAGPESVRGALDALGAVRIQHGIRALEDGELVARLRDDRIPLAVCPTSNVLLGGCPGMDAHPLSEIAGHGIVFTVNTDDPGYFGASLLDEYANAGRLLGLGRAGYAALARTSVETSYAPPELRDEMLAGITAWAAA